MKFVFNATNNEAEYEAVIAGLRIVKVLGLTKFEIVSNSKLVIGQITGDMETHDNNMKACLEAVQGLVQELGAKEIRFTHRIRDNNLRTGTLAGLALSLPGFERRSIHVEVLP